MRDMEEIVGYGFHPTNEQLVGHYLRKKRLDPDYSHPKITEIKINDYEPSELPGLALESYASERYFFVEPRYTNTKRKLVKRKTRGGTWKETGKKPDVKDKRSKEVIGIKRKLVFYQGPSTRNKNVRTNYVMDELHCKPDPLFKADFVVVRIKIKPNDSCDSSTTSESVISHHLTSDYNISSNRDSQLLNHSLYPNIEDLVTTNTSTEVEPLLVPAVWDSVIADNGLDHNSFYTQQMQIHLQQQVCDSLIDYNELDQNSFPAQQQVCNSLIDYNELDQNSFPAQQMQVHLQQGSSHSCDFSSDLNVLNTPLGSEWESSWSNLQWDVHSEKESGLSHTPDFDSTKPATGAAYVYSSSDESALLNGDCSLLNSPLGSEQENNRSNSQWDVLDEFYGKEPVHSRPTVFNLSMPVTEAYASQQQLYSDATLIDDPLLYGFSPMRENMASIACINNNYIPMRR